MMGLLLRVTLLILALGQLLSPCEAFGSYGGKGYNSGNHQGKSYEDPRRPQAFMRSSADVSEQGAAAAAAARRGLGISAWGIVVVILALILGGMGFYYFSICYPILCKKERNYNIIQL